MKALIERLKKDRLTIGSCESLTAGLFASTIAEVSGASAVLKGSIVTYWTECKVNVVHVREEIVEKYGVVSAPCAKEMAEKFDIRPRDTEIPTSSLSGGNAQKVVVAREVSIGGKLLVASQPTRGVDIGAIESIRTILQDVKKKGLGVLLVSADLEEIMSLSDRIVVMYEGRITGRMMAEEADEEKLGLLMMGGHDMEGHNIQEQEGGRQ